MGLFASLHTKSEDYGDESFRWERVRNLGVGGLLCFVVLSLFRAGRCEHFSSVVRRRISDLLASYLPADGLCSFLPALYLYI